jgi:hypothetical protein
MEDVGPEAVGVHVAARSNASTKFEVGVSTFMPYVDFMTSMMTDNG